MMNLSAKLPIPLLLSRPQMLLFSALSATILSAGIVPEMRQPAIDFVFGAPAYAQGNDDVEKYARAAYEIELVRQKLYSVAKRRMNGNIPSDVCRQQNIPSDVRTLCSQLDERAGTILHKVGLDRTVFNDITRRKASDPNLQRQIDQALRRIQSSR